MVCCRAYALIDKDGPYNSSRESVCSSGHLKKASSIRARSHQSTGGKQSVVVIHHQEDTDQFPPTKCPPQLDAHVNVETGRFRDSAYLSRCKRDAVLEAVRV